MKLQRIVILSSGSGSNAEALMNYFSDHDKIEVKAIYTNKSTAGVIDRAYSKGVAVRVFSNEDFNEGTTVLRALEDDHADYIVLAGFLRKIPTAVIQHFQDKIINIHHSLLPQYGGKGMYGKHVHKAVIKNKEKQSGITIHLVNEVYDEGRILDQFSTEVSDRDSAESLEEKIKVLEHQYFAPTIESYILKQ